MRLLVVLLVIGAAEAVAQTNIEWSASRPLTWDDFQGPVPPDAAPVQVAAAETALSWSYSFSLEWSPSVCNYRIVDIDTRASFDPSGSWVRPGHRTAAVLKHEQGHFDITYLHERRFRAALENEANRTQRCRGRSQRVAAQNVQQAIEATLEARYEAQWEEHLREQEAYDEQTRHGINSEIQAEWNARIAAELAAATAMPE